MNRRRILQLGLGAAFASPAMTLPAFAQAPADEAALLDAAQVLALRAAGGLDLLAPALSESAIASARTALVADAGAIAGQSWPRFFESAQIIRGVVDTRGDEAILAYANPIYDGAVITHWMQRGGEWRPTRFSVSGGERWSGGAEPWLESAEPALALEQAPAPSAQQLVDVADAEDGVAVLAAMDVLLSRGRSLYADAAAAARLEAIDKAIGSGAQADIAAADLTSQAAELIASLPDGARGPTRCFGAAARSGGDLVILQPRSRADLVYLVALPRDGAAGLAAASPYRSAS